MPKDRFDFKKFSITQGRASMKIGTDGVLLGAWAKSPEAENALDIGAGTGLMALMLAQKYPLMHIDAIDIEYGAFLDASQNIAESPWADRIKLYHCSLGNYADHCNTRYGLIVSNPPFFSSSLLPQEKARSLARHDVSLRPKMLFSGVAVLLNNLGAFYMIYPYQSFNHLLTGAATHGLYCNEALYIKPFQNKPPNRVIAMFQKKSAPLVEKQLTIYDDIGKYSKDYIELTRDYYLTL